jgi:iron complex transport system permease protein
METTAETRSTEETARPPRCACIAADCTAPDENVRARSGGFLPVLLLILGGIVSVILSLRHGAHPLSFADMMQLVRPEWAKDASVNAETVRSLLWEIRLPRIIAAILIGGGLSLAGASYQGLFRNSLVSPDILGASSGAAFGAALGLLLHTNLVVVQLLAFSFGLIAVTVTCILSRTVGGGHSALKLVLTGMVTGSLFVAGLSVIKTVADPYDTLPAITFWLMGSLSGVKWGDIGILFPPILIGSIILLLLRWKLNAMSFSEEEAKSMGVPIRKVRMLTLISATLISAVTVAVGGLIGWVGLLVPHMARFWVGPNNRDLLPVSLLLGGLYMLWADNLARWLFTTEFPLSFVTCICGAPLFLALLRRSGKGWAS